MWKKKEIRVYDSIDDMYNDDSVTGEDMYRAAKYALQTEKDGGIPMWVWLLLLGFGAGIVVVIIAALIGGFSTGGNDSGRDGDFYPSDGDYD